MGKMQSAEHYSGLLDNPNVQAGLDAIARAEGTDKAKNPYATQFGFRSFQSFKDHPRSVVSASGYHSSAAGRFQINEQTWNDVKAATGLKDFSPRSQQIAALALADRKGALKDLVSGNIRGFVGKANGVWASLPGSPHGQPTVSMAEIEQTFDASVNQYAQTPSPAQASLNATAAQSQQTNSFGLFDSPALSIAQGVTPTAPATGLASANVEVATPENAIDIPGSANLTAPDFSALSTPGKQRSDVPTSGIVGKAQGVVSDVLGKGYTVSVYSGQEPAGRAPAGTADRHPNGFAVDFDVVGPAGRVTDMASMQAVAQGMAARHGANIGYSNKGYMGAGRMHADTMKVSASPSRFTGKTYPGAAQWGKTARAWGADLDARRETREMPASFYSMNMPTNATPSFRDAPRGAVSTGMLDTPAQVAPASMGRSTVSEAQRAHATSTGPATAQFGAPTVGDEQRSRQTAMPSPQSLAASRFSAGMVEKTGPVAASVAPAQSATMAAPQSPSLATVSPAQKARQTAIAPTMASAYGQYAKSMQAGKQTSLAAPAPKSPMEMARVAAFPPAPTLTPPTMQIAPTAVKTVPVAPPKPAPMPVQVRQTVKRALTRKAPVRMQQVAPTRAAPTAANFGNLGYVGSGLSAINAVRSGAANKSTGQDTVTAASLSNPGATVSRNGKTGSTSVTNARGVTTTTNATGHTSTRNAGGLFGKGKDKGKESESAGGEGEGTYLCTVAHEFGWINDETLLADWIAGQAAPTPIYDWYASWAPQWADVCRQSVTARIITLPIVTLWARSMASLFNHKLRRG